jgi:hypothetical protein
MADPKCDFYVNGNCGIKVKGFNDSGCDSNFYRSCLRYLEEKHIVLDSFPEQLEGVLDFHKVGSCGSPFNECYLHKEYGQDPSTITLETCLDCEYNSQVNKVFKLPVNE